MTAFQALILGLVQGMTEFLPISSSAHLILVPWFFKWEDPGLAFDAFLHLGTLVAVFVYFIGDWFRLLRAGIASVLERRIGFDRDRLLFWLIVVGSVPAGLAGLAFHKQAEEAFRSPLLIAITLSMVGFLLYWIDGRYPALRNAEEMSFKDAMLIGIAQAFAIVPGVSRSGSTMTIGRFLGFSRESAAKFSFLLSFPIIAAAGLMAIRKLSEQGNLQIPLTYLMTGFVASLISGLISIHFLLVYLRSANFAVFAWYRIALGGVVVFWSLFANR